MNTRLPVIVIVGRTNVGKSTLFNAIVGERRAIVDELDGVTRDAHFALVTRYKNPFTLVDTGGLFGGEGDELSASVRRATERAIAEADLVIGVFDGISGIHPHDSTVINLLRKAGKPVIWVANKCEKEEDAIGSASFLSLGIDSCEPIASAHRRGLPQLVSSVMKKLEELGFDESESPLPEGTIRLAIVGKPNVGKSTLLNSLLGVERAIVSDIPGTTRDAVDAIVEHEGKKFVVVDTAGLRKKGKVEEATLERYSTLRTLQVLAASDVVALLVDASQGVPSEQDTKIAALAHDRGRSLIIVVNKWDAIEKNEESAIEFEREIRNVFKFAPYAPILFISAKTGRRASTVLTAAKDVYEAARERISTSGVNETLRRAFAMRPPPVYRGEPIKLLFATQASVAPPTFVLFLNHPKRLGYSYERHIKNILREEYGFSGNDIKLVLKKRGAEDNEDETLSA